MKKTASTIVLIFILSFSMSTFLVSPTNAAEDSWTTLEPMPTARAIIGVAVVDGKIYAIGGSYDSCGVEEYDPVTNTWTTKTPMPTPRIWFGIAVVENKIYVIGGDSGNWTVGITPTNVNEVYDPATDTWETLTPMPTPRMNLDANVVNGKIYMIGGFDYTWPYYSLDENEVYDPSTDSWITKASIPNATDAYSSAVVDNKIYVIGGRGYSFNQIYDPETDTWSSGTPIPVEVDYASAAATTGEMAPKRIYVIGGKRYMDAVNLTQIYDPEIDTWSTGTAMPTSRYGLGVAVVNDVLYAIGGREGWFGFPISAANEQYTPAGYIPEFPSWAILPLLLVATLVAILCKKRLPKNLSNQQKSFISGD